MAKPRPEYRLQGSKENGPDQLELITRSGTPAFATDEHGCITVWNKGAEELLGYRADRVLGKSCSEILCGVDLFGNRFCDHVCPLHRMVERGEPVRHFELDCRTESGHKIPVGFAIVVLRAARDQQYTLIHFMEKVDRQHEVSALVHRILHEAPTSHATNGAVPDLPAPLAPPLTSREIQVLRLLADGMSTERIAISLFISVPTTRNHVQSILRKLDVHSKLEAVSLAIRTHLI